MKLDELINENFAEKGQQVMDEYPDIIDAANKIIQSRVHNNREYFNKQDEEIRYEFGDDMDTLPSEALSMPIDASTIEYLMHPQDGSNPLTIDNNTDANELADRVFDMNKDSYDQYLHNSRNSPRGSYD